MKSNLPYSWIRKTVGEILQELGDPNISLVSWQTAMSFDDTLTDRDCGFYFDTHIAINPRQLWTKALNTIWHEIGHVLYPDMPHWWINLYASWHSGYDYYGRKAIIRRLK